MITLTYFEMGNRIPKVIHQTCPCKERLPTEIQENIRRMNQLNEDWEHRLYDDGDIESIILKHYNLEVLHVYQRINLSYGAARADFFRYLLMYAEGGIYLDIKSSVTRPLNDVIDLNDCYILSKWKDRPGWSMHPELAHLERGEYQQWHIIAVAGHPFLREVIERVIDNIQQYNVLHHGVGRVGVLRVTGPIAYTLAIENVKSLHPFREVNITLDFGFEYSIYESPAQTGKHEDLFVKHYSILRAPLINSNVFKDYSLVLLYYMKKVTKRIVRKVLPTRA
jgi:mannosyltransferase OCH1-like enzyme